MSPLVSVRDATHNFYRGGLFSQSVVRAVDGVSLAIQKGETLALIGESGSGKTTLGRLTLGTLKPTSGKVEFDGVDVSSLKGQQLAGYRRAAQAIFQDPYSSLDPFMTVFQILEEPLLVHRVGNRREREEAVLRALGEVRFVPEQEYAGKYPHMLSGGQRQRVNIARALMLRPSYVVADEPVSMIDVSSRAEILRLLGDLQQRHGLTILYITHDIATARVFAGRVAVMYLGRIVEAGRTTDVVRRPLHPYTMALVEAVPEPDPSNRLRDRSTIPGEPPSPSDIPAACRFHPRCKYFMPGKCDVQDPEFLEIEGDRSVACHLYPTARNE